jgi:hypothetical protein
MSLPPLSETFYNNIGKYGVCGKDLEDYSPFKICKKDKQQESNLETLYEMYGNDNIEMVNFYTQDTEEDICACGTKITNECYIVNIKQLIRGEKSYMFRVGCECIKKFNNNSLAKRCMSCNTAYRGKYNCCKDCRERIERTKKMNERAEIMEAIRKKEEEHQKYLSTRCTDCEVKVIDRTKFKRCYSCHQQYQLLQNCCIDCGAKCNHTYKKCYTCHRQSIAMYKQNK